MAGTHRARRRRDLLTQERPCVLCDGAVPCVLYESWRPAGLLGRRRVDARLAWRCVQCGSRVAATADEVRALGLPGLDRRG